MRLIKLSRVINNQICFNSKEAFNIYQLYQTRYVLFKCAYTHRVSQAIELMVIDVLKHADDVYKISKSVDDMEKFRFLNDSILDRIYADNNVKISCDLLDRIYRRNLYKFINQLIFPPSEKLRGLSFFTAFNICSFTHKNSNLTPMNLCVIFKKLDFTMSEENPLSAIRFFDKKNCNTSYVLPPARMSLIIPEIFEETTLRVFVRHEENEQEAKMALKTAFVKYKQLFPDSQTQILSW